MAETRKLATAAATTLAAAVAGCGVGPGESQSGSAELVASRGHGAERLLEARVEDPPRSETVVRFLDREAEIETSYAGNFVDSINGIEGNVKEGRSSDWYFYLNGYWSPVGAGEATVRAGDRVWWDYRDWSDAYRVPAVVGSWPEPFLHGRDGERFEVEVICFDAAAECETALERLRDEGVEAALLDSSEPRSDPGRTLRLLVGTWERVRSDPAAATLESGPGESGVYARPERCRGRWRLDVLTDQARSQQLLAAAGWVAAVQRGEEQPAWLVTATDADWLDDAVSLLDAETLADHYAIAVGEAGTQRLPAAEGEGAAGTASAPECPE